MTNVNSLISELLPVMILAPLNVGRQEAYLKELQNLLAISGVPTTGEPLAIESGLGQYSCNYLVTAEQFNALQKNLPKNFQVEIHPVKIKFPNNASTLDINQAVTQLCSAADIDKEATVIQTFLKTAIIICKTPEQWRVAREQVAQIPGASVIGDSIQSAKLGGRP